MFAYWGLLFIRWLVTILPEETAQRLGRIAGGLAFTVDRRHRKIALRNLRLVFPEISCENRRVEIGGESFRRLGVNVVEFLRLPVFLRSEWKARFRVEGEEKIRSGFRRGRGVIFALAHFGNWEYLALVPRLLGFRAAVIGQEIKNPAVDGLVKDIREEAGLDLLPKFEVTPSLFSLLKLNGAVALLADQRARRMNLEIPFFGHPAPTTTAPAILALKSGAALIPAFLYPEGALNRVVVEDEIMVPPGMPVHSAVTEITRRLASVFEQKIKERPELWLWGHRRWGR